MLVIPVLKCRLKIQENPELLKAETVGEQTAR